MFGGAPIPSESTNHGERQLAAWMVAYHSYVAHAIWNDNVAGVLQDGFVHPAEWLLKMGRAVSFESGEYHGQREIIKLDWLIAKLQAEGVIAPSAVTEQLDGIDLSQAEHLGFISAVKRREIYLQMHEQQDHFLCQYFQYSLNQYQRIGGVN